MKTKLGIRLSSIFNMIEGANHNIWDLCCDHGKLGLALLESHKASKVVFVDQVSSIMDDLSRKIQKIKDLSPKRYELLTLSAEKIQLEDQSLICLCGIGGDVAQTIMAGIIANNDCRNHQFLISAQYHMYDFRKFLISHDFKVLNEELVFEGKWGYELLLVQQGNGKQVDPIGRGLYDEHSQKNRKYFVNIINHYKRRLNQDKSHAEALELYEDLVK